MPEVQIGQEEQDKISEVLTKNSAPDDEQVKAFFNSVYRRADDVRRPRQVVWESAWNLYNSVYDWSAKANWQSKIPIAKVRQAVDRASAAFRRALIRMKSFYSIESESRLGTQKGLFTKSLMDMWLDSSNFIDEFTTALKSGLITSTIVMKVWWNYEEVEDLDVREFEVEQRAVEFGLETGTRKVKKRKPFRKKKIVGKLGLKAVDPFKFWIVPGTNGRAVIEQTEANIADLERLAKKGIYDKDAVDSLKASTASDSLEAALEAERSGELPKDRSKFLREVVLYHYWGDIFNEDGEVVMESATFTVAGSADGKATAVIRKPRQNPFFHGKPPYVVGTPYVVPFSTYNRGIVEDVIGIAQMITELSNLIVDGAMFDAIKAFEVDTDLLFSPGDVSNGIYPGLALRKKGLNDPTGNKQVVRAIDVGKIPREALATRSMMQQEFEGGTSITEFTAGLQGEGAETATEASLKTQQALAGLDDAARTVEETVINPTLELVGKTIYQFYNDYTIPRLIENFPEVSLLMRELDPADRYVVMFGSSGIDSFHFRARGISIMLDKQQNLEKIVQFFQLAAHIPGILQRLNVDAVLEEIVTSLGWNPQKMLIQPSNQGVIPAAGEPAGTPFPQETGQGLTPAQEFTAQEGARTGGSTNNPQAIDALLGALGG